MLTRIAACFALLLGVCVLSQAQTSYPGAPDNTHTLGKAVNHAETKLSASATDTATVFTVDDATKFVPDAFITFCIGTAVPGIPCIDSGEIAQVSASSGTAPGTITVGARNIAGTTAQNHAKDDTVHCTITGPYHNFVVDAIAATQAKLDTIIGGGVGYSTLLVDGTAMTPRSKIELDSGTGCTLTPTDDSTGGISKVSISCPGGAGYGIQVDGVAQPSEATIDFVHGTGIAVTPTVSGGVLHLAIAASGSGSGDKPFFYPFSAAGGAGSNFGSAIDLLPTGAATPANHSGPSLTLYTDDFHSAANQTAQVSFQLPGDWKLSSTLSLQLNFLSDTASGVTTWSAKTFCAASALTDLTGTISWNTPVSVTTTANVTPKTRNASMLTGISATGCSPGFTVWVQIQRSDSNLGTTWLKDGSISGLRTY